MEQEDENESEKGSENESQEDKGDIEYGIETKRYESGSLTDAVCSRTSSDEPCLTVHKRQRNDCR
jgi:hypothetical protein